MNGARLSLHRGAARAIERRDGSVGRLSCAAGIDPELVDAPEEHICMSSAWRLLELMGRMLNAPDYGFSTAAALEFADLGRLGRELTQALTLFDALRIFSRRAQEFLPVGEFVIKPHNGVSWFRHAGPRDVPQPPCDAQSQAEQFVLGVMIEVIQSTPASPHRTPVRSRAHAVANSRAEPLWLAELRTAVRKTLPWNVLPIESAAESAAMSTRTLQRRMAAEGLTYSRLLDQIRLDLAVRLLEGDATISDIALDLGYSANTHFTRAFKRWTGVTPSDFRVRRHSRVIAAATLDRLLPRAKTNSRRKPNGGRERHRARGAGYPDGPVYPAHTGRPSRHGKERTGLPPSRGTP